MHRPTDRTRSPSRAQKGNKAEIPTEYVLDATDIDEPLSLAGVHYTTGAEPRSITGEPYAPPGRSDPTDMILFGLVAN